VKKLIAILRMKCPKCYKGSMYKNPNPFQINELHVMPKHCDKCGQLFNPEPGFYIGAMYISYGLCVSVFMLCFFGLYIAFDVDPVVMLVVYGICLLILYPFIFRYSRVVYLHMFCHYDPHAIAQFQKEKKTEEVR
jgi:hypothetical protein